MVIVKMFPIVLKVWTIVADTYCVSDKRTNQMDLTPDEIKQIGLALAERLSLLSGTAKKLEKVGNHEAAQVHWDRFEQTNDALRKVMKERG